MLLARHEGLGRIHSRFCDAMLYDVLPPAIFFLSLGGITVVVARVAVRVRRDGSVVSMQALSEAAVARRDGAERAMAAITPRGRGIRVVTNRFSALLMALRNGASSVVHLPARLMHARRERQLAWQEEAVVAPAAEQKNAVASVAKSVAVVADRAVRAV